MKSRDRTGGARLGTAWGPNSFALAEPGVSPFPFYCVFLQAKPCGSALKDVCERNGFAHQPALRVPATEPVQDFTLFARLDTFGNEVAIQSARHRDDYTNHRHAARPIERLDETLVELDLIEAQGQQRPEIGIAGTEIIQRHMHAGGVAARQKFGNVARIEDQAFCDLKLHSVRRKLALAQIAEGALDQFWIVKLSRGQVDGDEWQRLVPARLQLGKHVADARDDIIANWYDERRFLGQADELGRRNCTTLWMLPAHECLVSRRASTDDLLDRLQTYFQFLALERGAQFAFKTDLVVGPGILVLFLLDATVVRMVLVPAAMALLGKALRTDTMDGYLDVFQTP